MCEGPKLNVRGFQIKCEGPKLNVRGSEIISEGCKIIFEGLSVNKGPQIYQ